MIRHFTTSVYVYDPQYDKFLFIRHKKLGKWLQPGGHIEPNELPDDAAQREVFEETGLHIKLIGERKPRQTDQVRPFAIQLNTITPGEHEHIDLVYLALASNSQEVIANERETEGARWFSLHEILDMDFDTYEPQKEWCVFFRDYLLNTSIDEI